MTDRFAGKRRITMAVILAVALIFLALDVSARPSGGLLLPDLIPLATSQLIGPETRLLFTFGVDAPVVIDGCFPDEIVRREARRCLRFEGIVGNFGPGHLEVMYVIDQSGRASAYQRIYRVDGSRAERFAIESELHPTHYHFHIRDFYVARLWRSTATGRILGTKPVATGDKNGFCPEDSRPLEEGSPVPSNGYSCLGDWETQGSPRQRVGISSRWMDIYGANLPDQFVEITGVPDGYYVLEVELDPRHVFKEVTHANNVVCVVLELEDTSAKLVDSTC